MIHLDDIRTVSKDESHLDEINGMEIQSQSLPSYRPLSLKDVVRHVLGLEGVTKSGTGCCYRFTERLENCKEKLLLKLHGELWNESSLRSLIHCDYWHS